MFVGVNRVSNPPPAHSHGSSLSERATTLYGNGRVRNADIEHMKKDADEDSHVSVDPLSLLQSVMQAASNCGRAGKTKKMAGQTIATHA